MIEIQLLDFMTINSSGTFAQENSMKGLRYKVRLLWIEGQMVGVIKIENVEHFVFRGVIRHLSDFLCLVYACFLCLAPNVHDLPIHVAILEHLSRCSIVNKGEIYRRS